MEPFIGEVRLMGFSYAPKNWAICNGAILQVHDYPSLFALISNYFGGDGVTNFAVPNLEGRIVLGFGEAPQMEQYTIAETGGTTMVTLTEDQIGSHTHSLPIGTKGVAGSVPGPTTWLSALPGVGREPGPPTYAPDLTAGSAGMADGMVQPTTGGGEEHNNMAPYVVMNYCIALQGVVPQRN